VEEDVQEEGGGEEAGGGACSVVLFVLIRSLQVLLTHWNQPRQAEIVRSCVRSYALVQCKKLHRLTVQSGRSCDHVAADGAVGFPRRGGNADGRARRQLSSFVSGTLSLACL
jgi:hypothetical protein